LSADGRAPDAAAGARLVPARCRRVVVKVGSGLVTTPGRGPDPERIGALAEDIAAVRAGRDAAPGGRETAPSGREVVLVSSGAIATGMARLGFAERPRSIPDKQAAAAVGQSALMGHYEAAFGRHGVGVGQVLLTAEDIGARSRYLNARNTLEALLRLGIVPIVNENDTVAVEEIKVGDNDTLSALVAALVNADLLVLLTDVDGLYTSDPSVDAGARKLDVVEAITEDITRLVWNRAGGVSVGGMATKLAAAQKAGVSGIPMVIAGGREPGVLRRLMAGEPLGTYFAPKADRLSQRKRWIALAGALQGRLVVDAGAVRALREQGRSLLPSGILEVEGTFAEGEVVAIAAEGQAREFARGLVNFDADEVRKIRGAKTSEIEERLGYKSFDEVVHRDDLVVL
jgi:glutamate 5-kinase